MSVERDEDDECEDEIHVIPARDQKEHLLTPNCWCAPYIDLDADCEVYVHNALDGRDKRFH